MMKGSDSSKIEPRRRVTNIHPHKVQETNQDASQLNATAAARQSMDEFTKVATPTDQYKFRSRGLSNRESLSNYVLTWEATFDRKIEHFVYPSLQTLDEPDIELFDEKAEENAKLHGHYGHIDKSNKQRRRSSVIDTNRLGSRTPSIVNKLITKKNVTYANSPMFEKEKEQQHTKGLAVNMDEKPIDYTLFVEEPLKWKMTDEVLPVSARRKFEEDNSFSDMLHKADKHMKEKMRADYEIKLMEKVKRKKEIDRLGLNKDLGDNDDKVHSEHMKRRACMLKKKGERMYNERSHMFLGGDQLYGSLKEDGRKRRDRISKSFEEGQSGANAYKTQHELIRDVQRDLKSLPEVELAATVKGGPDHLYDGLLFYQVKNSLHTHAKRSRELHMESLGIKSWDEDEEMGSPHANARSNLHSRGSLISTSPNLSNPSTPTVSSRDGVRSRESIRDKFSREELKSRGASRDSPSRELVRSREGMRNNSEGFDEVGDKFHDQSPGLRSSVRRALSSMYLGHDNIEVFRASNSLTDSLEHDIVELQLQKRSAEDKLLYDQLKAGILPEDLFRRGNTFEKMFILDLNYYNLGDEMGLCLGKALVNYQSISCLKLRECRLTSKSLPTIVNAISSIHLQELDLSYNDLHGEASKSLSLFFMQEPSVLKTLWLSRGQIRCSDIDMIMKGLIMHSTILLESSAMHELHTLYLDNNEIKSAGAESISFYLKGDGCKLAHLDMKWNDIGITGAHRISEAIGYLKEGQKTSSCTLTFLNLSCNNLEDAGAQSICSALACSAKLEEVHLTNNNVGTKACFILSKSLQGHPSMRILDISSNPLGEAGARCLFRVIVKSFMKCFVVMKSCTFQRDPTSFDSSNPTNQSPYSLDTSDPYQSALLHELMNLFLVEENHLVFETFNVKVRTDSGGTKGKASFGAEHHVSLIASKGQVIEKSTKKKYDPPHDALVTVAVDQHKEKPTVKSVCSQASLDLVVKIVANASSEMDRRNWIKLICTDLYFTTDQVDYMISFFEEHMVQISMLTIFENVWRKLLDTENKYDFLCKHLRKSSDRIRFINTLVSSINIEAFRFNWINCTGHWYLDLSDTRSRDIMINMMALNTAESTEGREYGRRGDTSQRGDWSNFRNEKYRGEDISIVSQFGDSEVPTIGAVEFDYVCTTRPKTKEVETISLQDRELLFERIGFSKRFRCPKSKCLVAFLELQVASCKYYFKVNDVIYIMHGFDEDDKIQVKVVTTLFSRIADLENFYQILRIMPQRAQDDVARRLGWLNIMNPVLPYHTFTLKLTHIDNRFVANMLLSLGSQYEDNNCKEVKGTDIPLIDAYASLNRLLHDSSPKSIKFTYNQVTDKSTINWNQRFDKLQYFLLGTHPINKVNIFKKPMDMYKEMAEEKYLSRGPLDLQYKEYLKSEAKHARDVKEIKQSRSRKRAGGPNES